MASMVVFATTAIPDRLGGALSRWMIEVAPGLFVGTLSARVRDELWATATEVIADGMAILIHPHDNEQGFLIHTAGERRRHPIDFDGLTLIAMQPPDKPETPLIWPDGW